MQWELSLHGLWDFSLDEKEDNGHLGNELEKYPVRLNEKIKIPGILQDQGYGNEITTNTPWLSSLHDKLWYQREEYKTKEKKVQTPFLSQPKRHYIGKAWYQTSFLIPGNLKEEVFYFTMECVKEKTRVWLDGNYIGSITSLCTPHIYYLGELEEGEHTITISIDNSLQWPHRPDGHMVSDALGATWNGMVGKVTISSLPYIHMEGVRLFPNADTKEVLAEITIRNCRKDAKNVRIHIGNTNITSNIEPGNTIINLTTSFLKEGKDWDEFSPNIHSLRVLLEFDNFKQEKNLSFGFRKLEVKDGLFLINNRPTYFRGTHSGGDFPLTGYPSTSVAQWKKIIRKCKDFGLNYMRFHSFCPPEAAFVAADEEGFYLQVECGMWNIFHEDGQMVEFLWKETKRILDTFGNHPSFVMLSPSNEPGGDWYKPLTDWVIKSREYDSRRLYTAQSGWPYPMKPKDIKNTDYVYFHRSGYGIMPGGTIRNSKGWNGKDYRKSLEDIPYPVISHEMGQWCSYPDFEVIEKFTGYLEPSNYIVFRENAKRRGVLSQNKEFSYSSGRLKAQLYKEEIEANFRTPHIYGFELLDLHDYIGQGTALVGFLDPFWDDKGIISKEEFQEFCSETVPLLRIEKRVFTRNDRFDYPLEICHFGKEELKGVTVYWKLIKESGSVFKSGSFNKKTIPIGKNTQIGRISLPLHELATPASYTIEVGICDTRIRNRWNIWVYDEYDRKKDKKKEGVIYTRSLKKALEALELGKKVIYSPLPEHHRLDSPPLQTKTVFWNGQMGPKYGRGMGYLCQNNHKALAKFPTKEYKEWQWDEIIHGSYGLNLSEFPSELTPIVQGIDDWNRNYRLGMILECKVGKGSLLLVTADIESDLRKRPAANQLRRSLFDYVSSEEFSPVIEVRKEILEKSFFPRRIMLKEEFQVKIGGEVQKKEEIRPLIDGDPRTSYTSKQLKYPFRLEFESKKEIGMKGLVYMPRQNDRQRSGDIKACKVEVYSQGDWQVVFEGELPSSLDPKEILFSHEISTKNIRFTGLYGFSGKDISIWEEKEDGWYQKIIDYEDQIAAIGNLLCIPAKIDLDSVTDQVVEGLEGDYQKEEPVEKTITKEIDD